MPLFRRKRTQVLPPPAYAGFLNVLLVLCAFAFTSCSTQKTPAYADEKTLDLRRDVEVSPQWREFDGYYGQMIARIEASWRHLVEASSVFPHSKTHVVVTFRLNDKGEVTILKIEETAGKLGVQQCTSAIKSSQPFAPWTPEMVAKLGNEQVLIFGFNYQ